MSKLFQGEMMTCRGCGKKQKSNPHVESNWTAIEIDKLVIYFCPKCFGNLPFIRETVDEIIEEENRAAGNKSR